VFVTVLDVIQRSTAFLEKKGVESPRLQGELLLAALLRLRRMQLYLNFERELTDSELTAFREMIRRRGEREPLQYIVGSVSFCGFEITVNSSVLIPRPETELLAEQGWTFLSRHSAKNLATALDFGTGSGCLAIALAIKCDGTQVEALDVSCEALAVARKNAENHGLEKRIHFTQGDSLGSLQKQSSFDLIISNPPYVPTKEIETLQPEVRDFEPRAALDGGSDGLNYFRQFASQAESFLKPGGQLILEFGDSQLEAIREIFQAQNWIVMSVQNDYHQRPRIITVVRNK
jgi:release factor glutamine methyltransferase